MARHTRQFQKPPADLFDALEALATGRLALAEAREQLRRTLAAEPRQADLLALWVERARDEGRLPISVAEALLVLAAGVVSEDVPTIFVTRSQESRLPAGRGDDGARATANPPEQHAGPPRSEPPAPRAAPVAPAPASRSHSPKRIPRGAQAAPAAAGAKAAATGADLAPATGLKPGAVLKDCYVLGDRLGGGGMAEIYKALDRRRERSGNPAPWVALKVVTTTDEQAPAAAALAREAALASRLEHPNILRIFGIDRDGPHLFLAMELLDGESLARRLDQRRQRPLARLHALPLVEGLCHGLAHMHAAGLVHGDIKPGNLFVTADERLKIIDFGVARDLRSPAPVFPAGHTAEYASCEVLAGEAPQPADDIFSAACVAYRLLAGQRAFGSRTAREAEAAGLRPAPIESLSAGQWRALDQALAFRRADRPDDINQFLSAFKGLRDEPERVPARSPATRSGTDRGSPPATRRPRPAAAEPRWRYAGTWAAFVLVCAVGATLAWWVPGNLPTTGRSPATAPAGAPRVTAPPDPGTAPAEVPVPTGPAVDTLDPPPALPGEPGAEG
jgi:serine/threonine protein kinase